MHLRRAMNQDHFLVWFDHSSSVSLKLSHIVPVEVWISVDTGDGNSDLSLLSFLVILNEDVAEIKLQLTQTEEEYDHQDIEDFDILSQLFGVWVYQAL